TDNGGFGRLARGQPDPGEPTAAMCQRGTWPAVIRRRRSNRLGQCAAASPATGTPEAPGRRALSRRWASSARSASRQAFNNVNSIRVVRRAAAANALVFGGERGKRLDRRAKITAL